jgi:AcrR family transcriptional regulator
MTLRISRALDGRARRRERSRDAIVRALHALIGEDNAQPTAQQVAERAKVGLRSVFRHFDDMDSLYAEVGAQIQAEARPLIAGAPTEGSVEERLRRIVSQRGAFFEHVAPYVRAGALGRRRSPFLQRQHVRLVRELRERLLVALPELGRAPANLLESLDLALSFDSWDRLRGDQKLSRERAAAVLETTALALAATLSKRRKKR